MSCLKNEHQNVINYSLLKFLNYSIYNVLLKANGVKVVLSRRMVVPLKVGMGQA